MNSFYLYLKAIVELNKMFDFSNNRSKIDTIVILNIKIRETE
jgi:hypothetical protein